MAGPRARSRAARRHAPVGRLAGRERRRLGRRGLRRGQDSARARSRPARARGTLKRSAGLLIDHQPFAMPPSGSGMTTFGPMHHRPDRQLCPVAHIELSEDPVQVFLDGSFRKMKLISDFLVRLGLPHQIHDLSFAKTEVVADGPMLPYWPSTGLADPFRACRSGNPFRNEGSFAEPECADTPESTCGSPVPSRRTPGTGSIGP
jgi:hypothetical protein